MLQKFLQTVVLYYTPNYSRVLVQLLDEANYLAFPFYLHYWRTNDFEAVKKRRPQPLPSEDRLLLRLIDGTLLLELLVGVAVIVLGFTQVVGSGQLFGSAIILAYPVVLAILAPLLAKLADLSPWPSPKRLAKSLVCVVLERQVKSLRQKHKLQLIAVAGSVGKTSTKLAIAETLATLTPVQFQEGNYNDRLTVPLVIFGQTLPNLYNIPAWLKIFRANRRMLEKPYPYTHVVVELGVDGPGQMRHFAYLKPDLTVVTAISPEHMEYFKTLDRVAREELEVFRFSHSVLINIDDSPAEYLKGYKYVSYGTSPDADYHLSSWQDRGLKGSQLKISRPHKAALAIETTFIGQQGAKIATAAVAVADQCGMKPAEIRHALATIRAFAGRMRVIPGIEGSFLLDDTYNASPIAVKAGLDALYAAKTKQRLAILGSMNELGSFSAAAHQEVGEYCDSQKLALVVTIGEAAEKYLAPAARANGCKVKSFLNPYDAGQYVKKQLQPGAVVLAEGSQNGVFAEEALKPLLADESDQLQLVRQSDYWLGKKQQQFAAK